MLASATHACMHFELYLTNQYFNFSPLQITKPVFESCQKKQGLLSDFGICSSPKVARDGISPSPKVAKAGISPRSKVARDGISHSPKVAKAGISPSSQVAREGISPSLKVAKAGISPTPKVAKVAESRGSSESEESTGNSSPAPSPSSLKRKGGCRSVENSTVVLPDLVITSKFWHAGSCNSKTVSSILGSVSSSRHQGQ